MSSDADFDDASRLRAARDTSDNTATRRRRTGTAGSPSVVAKVVTVTGAASPSYFKMQGQVLLGAEVEGGAGTLSNNTAATFMAMNLGTVKPPATTALICTFVDYRWAFRYDG